MRVRIVRLGFVCSVIVAAIAASEGCATTNSASSSLLPTAYQTRVGPYLVHTTKPLEADSPEIVALTGVENDLGAILAEKFPGDAQPIEVYVLKDRESYEHYLRYHHPDLPYRRAFFVGEGERSVIYTFSGENLGVDLRHEATHALLHARTPAVPAWLDEGLAEYLESPDTPRSETPEHLAPMPAESMQGNPPNLARLERMADSREMTKNDYQEAWLWVHYFLGSSEATRTAILGYLKDLESKRSVGEIPPISARVPKDILTIEKVMLYMGNLRERASRPNDPAAAKAAPVSSSLSVKSEKTDATLWDRIQTIFAINHRRGGGEVRPKSNQNLNTNPNPNPNSKAPAVDPSGG